MNVLSLFDGMSCGQQALKQSKIKVNKYFASEIDKYAIQITQKNHPETIQMGCVKELKNTLDSLPKIDLLFAGFPCQAWSVAGKQKGDNDPRGELVHDLIYIWKYLQKKNPKMKFLFENVKMKKEFIEYINGLFGVEPIEINSALVSAQNRKRLYWTNIEGVEQPEDKGILLKDIVYESCLVDREKSHCITSSIGRTTTREYFKKNQVQMVFEEQKNSLILTNKALKYMNRKDRTGRDKWDHAHHSDVKKNKSSVVVANFYKGVPYNVLKDLDCIRKLTTIECERLQTLPDNYTEGVSNTQRYKMIGNGWTVDVISHILKGLRK